MKSVTEGSDALHARRVAASQQSAGTSDEAIYRTIERRLGELDAAGDVLDFGAGTGQLTLRLHETLRYRSVTGADLFPRAADLPAAVSWIEGDLNDRLPIPPASFDLVVAAEVIEHLENPRSVCRELFRLLRPGGHVLLSTPNNESWRAIVALLIRGHFVAFGDTSYPAHITALVRKDLERTLVEAGFDSPTFTFTDAGGVPGLPARQWRSLIGRLARGLRFSDNLLVTARKAA
jgi:2-polyprenyl-3-methyl-5-hydroxy-6-metoxy-1,4-benzoquinol methylase